jgi:hypothetical protein
MTAPITCWGIKTDLDLKLEPLHVPSSTIRTPHWSCYHFCYPTPRDETKQDGTMRCRPALNSILFRVNCFLCAVGRCRSSSAGAAPLHRCRSLRFQSREGQVQASVGKTPRAQGVKCVMRCSASRSESRPGSAARWNGSGADPDDYHRQWDADPERTADNVRKCRKQTQPAPQLVTP